MLGMSKRTDSCLTGFKCARIENLLLILTRRLCFSQCLARLRLTINKLRDITGNNIYSFFKNCFRVIMHMHQSHHHQTNCISPYSSGTLCQESNMLGMDCRTDLSAPGFKSVKIQVCQNCTVPGLKCGRIQMSQDAMCIQIQVCQPTIKSMHTEKQKRQKK